MPDHLHHLRKSGALRRLVNFCVLTLALSLSIPETAFAAPTASETTSAQTQKKRRSTKSKKTAAKEAPAEKTEEAKPEPPKKKERTPVVRGREVLKLKRKKDGDSKLYGYENDGDKYYWWAEAHFLGAGKEQLNQGYETQWVITPQYERAAKEFSEGLAAVEVGGKVGFIDRSNRFIIPPVFEPMDDLAGFRFGLAAVKKDGKYGFIDKSGTFIFPPEYDEAENFGDDCLAVVRKGKKFGCIDLLGDSVIPCEYIAKEVMKTMPMKNKPYRDAKKRAKERWEQGYYDDFLESINDVSAGVDRLIANPNFTETHGDSIPAGARAAGDGFYLTANSAGKMGATDTYGRLILPCIYDKVRYDSTQRLFIVDNAASFSGDTKAASGIASTAGGWIIPPMFESIGDFNAEGYAPVSIGEHQGQVDVFGMVNEEFLRSLLQASVEESGTFYTRRMIGVLPTCAPAHNCLGIYYASECDNLKDAIHHFTVAHNLDPDNEDFKTNMKAAKSERNSRRWNRVLTGMSIAAAVLTVGAVTYSAVKGTPMQTSSFSSGSGDYTTGGDDYAMSDGGAGSSSGSSGRGRSKASSSSSSSDAKGISPSDASNIHALQRSYDNYESMVAHCNTYPEKHQAGDKKEYQRKMREIRLKLKNKYGIERTQSSLETN